MRVSNELSDAILVLRFERLASIDVARATTIDEALSAAVCAAFEASSAAFEASIEALAESSASVAASCAADHSSGPEMDEGVRTLVT
jgi:hypothetical protein